MPELPEVETVVRELRVQVLHRRIIRAKLLKLDMLKNSSRGARGFARFFPGRFFQAVERFGKFILFTLDDERKLLAHLGMTGKFTTAREGDPQPRWLCSQYHFEEGLRLDHVDVRRLGRLEIYPPGLNVPVLQRLGIDPFSPDFGPDTLRILIKNRSGTKRRTRAIHTLLLDQSLIAGVGNIYAAEALFRAGVRPSRQAGKLTIANIEVLAAALKNVMQEALKAGGTTISDYRRVDDKKGGFLLMLKVYGREGEPCRACDQPIRSLKLGGRTAYYCARCQK